MGTRQDIRNKVRQLTGRKSAVQLTDTEIDFQIDNYYTGEFPVQFRSLDLRQEYSMTLTPNQDVYTIDANSFQSVEPTCFIEGYPTLFVTNRTLLHSLFPDIRQDVNLGSGTGITGPYSFSGNNAPSAPVLKGSVLVYADIAFGTQTSVVDDRQGNLVDLNSDGSFGTVRGTFDYETGAVTVTFASIVPSGTNINIQSRQYQANRPTTVFYWVQQSSVPSQPQQGQLTFRPVPDKAYNVRIVSYNYPVLGSSSGSQPMLSQWWEALAYGASMKIFENNKDLESAAQMSELLERKLLLLGRTEWFQLRSQGTQTIYNTPTNWTGPGYGYFGFFGNNW
jgi:hypothetical protein